MLRLSKDYRMIEVVSVRKTVIGKVGRNGPWEEQEGGLG